MCFATVLGDTRLFARTTRTELVGIGLAIACAALIALLFGRDASVTDEIRVRMQPSPLDVGLAVGGGRPAHWYYKHQATQQVKGRLAIWSILLVLILVAMGVYRILGRV